MVRVASPAPLGTSTSPRDDFTAQLTKLDRRSWAFAHLQAQVGGEVSEASPELWQLYRAFLASTGGADTQAQRQGFFRQILDRLVDRTKQVHGRAPQSLDEAVDAMSTYDAADEARFVSQNPSTEKVTPGRPTRTERPAGRSNRDTFVRTTPKPVVKTVPADDDVLEIPGATARTPEDAEALRADGVSRDEAVMARMQDRIRRGRSPFEGNGDTIAQRAYGDFLVANRLADSPSNQRAFVRLLAERPKGTKDDPVSINTGPSQRRYYADRALADLRGRNASGPIVIDPSEDRWLTRVLSDPKLTLSAEERALVNRVRWTESGLTRHLFEEVAERRLEEESRRPVPGAPYSVMVNVDSVFDGDPQKNAFTLAARAAGYTDDEVTMARTHLEGEGVPLFVDHGKEGSPKILERNQVEWEQRGGQDFVRYKMSENASKTLLDARYAKQQGYESVAAYRTDFEDTWANRVTDLGKSYLELEKARDEYLGLDETFIGPALRGKYDAIRELTLVGSNAANFAEMAVDNAGQAIRKGDLMVSIRSDERLRRYYDASSQRIEQTVQELGRTYPSEEATMVDSLMRGVVASGPKVAVSTIPGAAVFYNALKHANHPMEEFAEETAIDLLSLAGGLGVGRFGTTLATQFTKTGAKVVPKLVDNELAKSTIRQVMERGTSGVGGATMNVLGGMGPTYLREVTATNEDRANRSPEEQKAIDEALSMKAFSLNAMSGLLMGVVLPTRHMKDDLVLLSEPGTSLAGPVFRTKTPGADDRYFAAVQVGKGKGSRVEFVEGTLDDPQMKKAVSRGQVKDVRQSDVDVALADSRLKNRYTPKEREKLFADANTYASKKMLADANASQKSTQQIRMTRQNDGKAAPIPKPEVVAQGKLQEPLYKAYPEFFAKHPQVRAEMDMLSPAQYRAAFGEGPYAAGMLDLFRTPGFGEFAIKQPSAARKLYDGYAHTNVRNMIAKNERALLGRVAPSEIGPQALANTVKQLDAMDVRVSNVGAFTMIERPAGSKDGRPAIELVLKDPATSQRVLRKNEFDQYVEDATNLPMRYRPDTNLVLGPDGKPIAGIDRSVLISTHGGQTLEGIDDEMVKTIAEKIAARDDIDSVLLFACRTGDKTCAGPTTAQQLSGKLNLELSKAKQRRQTTTVYAARDPGLLTNVSNADGRASIWLKNDKGENKPYEMVPASKQSGDMATVEAWFEAELRRDIDSRTEGPTNTLQRPPVLYRITFEDDESTTP